MATQGSSEWNEESIIALARVLMRQARDKYAFPTNDIIPCIYKRFCDNLDLEQDGDDFLVSELTSNLEVLADEFKINFLVKKLEIASLKPEHQNGLRFLKRRISVDNFGWHVELDQRYVKSLQDAMAMIHCKSMALLDEGTGEQSTCGRFE